MLWVRSVSVDVECIVDDHVSDIARMSVLPPLRYSRVHDQASDLARARVSSFIKCDMLEYMARHLT